MMATSVFSSIQKAMKGVDNAILLGTKRAMNRSASSTRTFINKSIRQETGLKSEYVTRRLLLNRTQTGNNKPYSFRANVAIAMKAILPLRLFSPKPKRVRTPKGDRAGVTVKIGKQGRSVVTGAFLMTLKNGVQLVTERKGIERTPTKQVFTLLWQETVQRNFVSFNKFASNTFKNIVGREIDNAINQRQAKINKES